MKKLSGGILLDCGHYQVISPFRRAAHLAGYTQHSVWCIECGDWVNITPSISESIDKIDN